MEVINAIGRRKSAVARVYVKEGNGKITINKRDLANYFPSSILQYVVKQPLLKLEGSSQTLPTTYGSHYFYIVEMLHICSIIVTPIAFLLPLPQVGETGTLLQTPDGQAAAAHHFALV